MLQEVKRDLINPRWHSGGKRSRSARRVAAELAACFGAEVGLASARVKLAFGFVRPLGVEDWPPGLPLPATPPPGTDIHGLDTDPLDT